MGSDGRLYGTTQFGGTNTFGPDTAGTAFAITTNGQLTVLTHFNGTNGVSPVGRLFAAADGHLYGTTSGGGTNGGAGTVFQLSTNGTLTTLAVLRGELGLRPFSGVTQGPDGALYGVTAYRTAGSTLTNGTIYRVTTNGAAEVVHRFAAPNGLYGFGDLMVAQDGNLYGTLSDVTLVPAPDGNLGSVFRLMRRPTIRAFSAGQGAATLTWDTFRDVTYCVDWTSSLTPPDWIRVRDQWATGLTHTATVPMLEEAWGCYRVGVLP